MSYKCRCTGEGDKLKLWLVLLFQTGLNFCLFTISTDVLVTTKNKFQACWEVCGGGDGVGVGSGGEGLGGREDATLTHNENPTQLTKGYN